MSTAEAKQLHWTERSLKKSDLTKKKDENTSTNYDAQEYDADRKSDARDRLSVDTKFNEVNKEHSNDKIVTNYAYNVSPKSSNIRQTFHQMNETFRMADKKPRWKSSVRIRRDSNNDGGGKAIRAHLGLQFGGSKKDLEEKTSVKKSKKKKNRKCRKKSRKSPRYMKPTKSTEIRLRTPKSPRALRCRPATREPSAESTESALRAERLAFARKGASDRLFDVIESRRKLYGRSVQSVEDAFDAMDANNDGVLSFEEMEEGLHRLDLGFSETEVDELLRNLDANGDGFVDLNEFRSGLLESRMKKLRDFHAVYATEIQPTGTPVRRGPPEVRGYYDTDQSQYVVAGPDTHVEDLWPSRLRDYSRTNEFLKKTKKKKPADPLSPRSKQRARVGIDIARAALRDPPPGIPSASNTTDDDENAKLEERPAPSSSARRGSYFGTYPKAYASSKNSEDSDILRPFGIVERLSPKHRSIRNSPLARFKTMWRSSLRPEVYTTNRKRLAFKARSKRVDSRLSVSECIVQNRKIERALSRASALTLKAVRTSKTKEKRFRVLLQRMKSPKEILVWQDFIVLFRRVCNVANEDFDTLLQLVRTNSKDGTLNYFELHDKMIGHMRALESTSKDRRGWSRSNRRCAAKNRAVRNVGAPDPESRNVDHVRNGRDMRLKYAKSLLDSGLIGSEEFDEVEREISGDEVRFL